MKVYYTKQTEYMLAKGKLKDSESAIVKAEKEGSNKKGNEKRKKNLDKAKDKVIFYHPSVLLRFCL